MYSVHVSSIPKTFRKCYWCGPLADQVHRSARPLPCDVKNLQVTTCDSGYNFCATVATADPYIESRHCVKKYKNECYGVICGVTGQIKMICPCHGDLCNGVNTEPREEAFRFLVDIVFQNSSRTLEHINRTRQIREAPADEDISATSDKPNESIALNPTTNGVTNDVTIQPTVESNIADRSTQSSPKPSDYPGNMELTSVSLTINNKDYTVAIDEKNEITINYVDHGPTTEKVTEYVTDKRSEPERPITVIETTTKENNVIVVTEKINEKNEEIANTHDDGPKSNQMDIKLDNNDSEMLSDEPAKNVEPQETDKKEPEHQQTKKENTSGETNMMTTTVSIVTQTDSISIPSASTLTTATTEKNHSISVYNFFKPITVLFYIILSSNLI